LEEDIVAIPAENTNAAGIPVRRARMVAVLAAVLGPSVIWLVTVAVLGHRLEVTQGATTAEVGLSMVIATSLTASLAGWILLAVLERWTRRARTLWTILAAVVLVASFGGPLTAVAATTTKLALSLMHLAVGAALIPTLARTAAPGR
jgi:hypothetical protein